MMEIFWNELHYT